MERCKYIYQESLDRFLSIAQRFRLDGLMGNDDDNSKQEAFKDIKYFAENVESEQNVFAVAKPAAEPVKSKSRAVVTDDKVMVPLSSEDASDVDNTVNQYIGTGEDGRNECTVCGKKQGNESGAKSNLKRHIETHLEVFVIY